MEQFCQAIQNIISSEMPDKEKLDAIENMIGLYINNIRKYPDRDYVRCYFTIKDKPNENGNYIIPEHPSIPKESWGKEAINREICWYERKEDQFLSRIGVYDNFL